MGTAVIIVILVLIILGAVKSYMKKLSSGCCGGETEKEKKIKVEDKDASHYPHSVRLGISGMSCDKCRVHAENALNALDGVWAEVDLGKGCAYVRMKKRIPDIELRRVIADAGYTVTEITG